MQTLIIKVYDENNNVVKKCEAKDIDIKFGTIRSLMKLLKIDDIDDTASLLRMVYETWEELTRILSQCFPDMTDKDWDNVKLNELIQTLIDVFKSSFSSILSIPSDSKN